MTASQDGTQSAAVALIDVLHQAPRLLEVLTQDSWKALSAASKSLNETVHSLVTIITIEHLEDIPLLAKGSWPHLSMVILPKQRDARPDIGALRHRWQLLACVSLGERGFGLGLGTTDVAVLLSSQQSRYTTLDNTELAVRPLEHLLSSKWSESQSLCLHQVQETVVGTAVMKQLSKGRWQCLSHFELCGKQLDVANILLLFKSKWAELHQLKLMLSNLDATVIAQLSTDGWPSLKHLQLTYCAIPDADAILHLATLNLPQLAYLYSTETRITPATVQQLSQAPLVKLISLFLQSAGLGATALLNFAQADWSRLKYLDLSQNCRMGAAAIRHLVQAQLPGLRGLGLSECGLDDLAIQCLIEGAWPILQNLDLSTNHLDTRALKYLAKGNWASLKHLTLINNDYDTQAIEVLMKGNWHSLTCLSIDLAALNTVNAGMLQIGPQQLLECQRAKEQNSTPCSTGLLRNYTDAHTPSTVRSLWPHLQKKNVFAWAGA